MKSSWFVNGVSAFIFISLASVVASAATPNEGHVNIISHDGKPAQFELHGACKNLKDQTYGATGYTHGFPIENKKEVSIEWMAPKFEEVAGTCVGTCQQGYQPLAMLTSREAGTPQAITCIRVKAKN